MSTHRLGVTAGGMRKRRWSRQPASSPAPRRPVVSVDRAGRRGHPGHARAASERTGTLPGLLERTRQRARRTGDVLASSTCRRTELLFDFECDSG